MASSRNARPTPAKSSGAKPPAKSSGAKPPAKSSGAKPPAKSSGAKPPAKSGGAKPPAKSGGAKPAAPQPMGARLGVSIGGKLLPDDEARVLWETFSAYMDEHRGDFAGFAKLRGYKRVQPEYQRGRAILVVEI